MDLQKDGEHARSRGDGGPALELLISCGLGFLHERVVLIFRIFFLAWLLAYELFVQGVLLHCWCNESSDSS